MASVGQVVTENCLEFIAQQLVFSNGESRLEYCKLFRELHSRESTLKNLSYGKLHNLSKISEFVELMEGARADDQEPCLSEQGSPHNTKPFYKWKPFDWKAFRGRLTRIQMSMLREDANATVDDIYRHNGDRNNSENPSIDEARSQSKWYSDNLYRVVDLLTLQEKLAPFRENLESMSWYFNDEASEPLPLPNDLVVEYMETLDNLQCRNEALTKDFQKVFRIFLKSDGTDTFRSPATIRGLLDDHTKAYSFTLLRNRVDKLIRRWVSDVFQPVTIVGRANPEAAVEESQTDALQRLQRSRARLRERVEDPMSETVAAATLAQLNKEGKHPSPMPSGDEPQDDEHSEKENDRTERSPSNTTAVKKYKRRRGMSPITKGRMLDKKRSATRLDFTQSDDEEIEDPEVQDEVLPDVRRPIQVRTSPGTPSKKKRSQEKSYQGRRVWSDIEKQAVKDGIIRFGVGMWARIKNDKGVILRDRTSGQIKDCYRTMKRRGELDNIEEAWPERKKLTEEEKEEGKEQEKVDEKGEQEDK
ncbi:unnamed protein product [Pseudo-nitzschia multistriata]|uniref:Myb-like domain-containing protein n=1 Tax=Pseudo-nitzschia multistriata TaxID=183589 RepID=A0A448Z9M3_9STRA|nr:unnamed protein product [Pseudo-nitzschia multistriata]